ncbi:MAG: hypothetical protein ACKO6L_07710 [Flavobacteriales bacterium]
MNILLMFITAVLAFFMPFETFLIAYAFLGPLHYLTEISWLHDRQYFAKGKYDYLVLLIIGVLLSFAAFSRDLGVNMDFYKYFAKMNMFDKLIVLAFFSSILFALVKNLYIKLFAIVVLFIFVNGWFAPNRSDVNENSTTVFALTSLLPTLIHVYIFTGLFMLYGALKNRSKSGLVSVAAFVALPIAVVFFMPTNPEGGFLSQYGMDAYWAGGEGFFTTNVSIINHFDLATPVMDNAKYLEVFVNDQSGFPAEMQQAIRDSLTAIADQPHIWKHKGVFPEFFNKTVPLEEVAPYDKNGYWDVVFHSNIGIMLMRFFAFAYLYHYLNWFSKTEVIKWHKIPKMRFLGIVVLWLTACGLYAYDYALGLNFLFFLSFSHVLLEFPLNIVSIVGIGKESLSIYKSGFSQKEVIPPH